MSPRRSLNTESPPGSENGPRDPSTPLKSPSKEQGVTESKQSRPGDPRQKSPSEGIDPEAVEPFPPDLFRLPVPNEVFGQMPEMSDAALRCLLALIHQSFRFDPEASTWTCPDESFSRRDIERKAGLSDQGTRNGLSSLEEAGWAEVDRSGRSYSYALRMEVPTRRYTYVPTTLLEKASELPSTTALRAVLAVLRETWGWTSKENHSGQKRSTTVHKRWAEISTSRLSRLTGRSEPAIRKTARVLEGEWIFRVQPGQGAYLYRLLPGAFEPENGDVCEEESRPEDCSSNPPTTNEATPDRQQSYAPSSYKETSLRDKQSQENYSEAPSEESTDPEEPDQDSAMPGSSTEVEGREKPDFSDLPDQKQSLAQRLVNAGVWPDRARECLHRYSVPRVEANFRLWRQRKNDPQAPRVDDDGAFLCAAITDAYASISGSADASKTTTGGSPQRATGETPEPPGAKPPGRQKERKPEKLPEHKEKVSATRKRNLIRHRPEVTPEHFHRYRCAENPSEKQFIYFAPSKEGPTKPHRSTNRREEATAS